MTDLIILAALLAACCAFVEWRRRAAAPHRRAESERPGGYAFLTTQGWEVGTSRSIPAGTLYIGEIPTMTLEAGPLRVLDERLEAELWRFRLEQSYALRMKAPRPGAGVIITGIT